MDKLTKCENVTELLALYHYGELTAVKARQVEEHLDGCSGCAAELTEMRAALKLVPSGLPATVESARVKHAVMDRIAGRRKSLVYRLAPAMAAAALAVVVALVLNFSDIFTRQPAQPPGAPMNGAVTASVDRDLLENYDVIANLDMLEELDALENMEEL